MPFPVAYSTCDSPLGELLLTSNGRALTGLYLPHQKNGPVRGEDWTRDDGLFSGVREQLGDYFEGHRPTFEVALAADGSGWQREVWAALREIPYGVTVNYGELAARLGNPKAARAVGLANSKNPLSIIVPCHRVVGADGELTGYAGGVEAKRWLLAHEAKALPEVRGLPGLQAWNVERRH